MPFLHDMLSALTNMTLFSVRLEETTHKISKLNFNSVELIMKITISCVLDVKQSLRTLLSECTVYEPKHNQDTTQLSFNHISESPCPLVLNLSGIKLR